MFYDRYIQEGLRKRAKRPFVDVLFGARQTGKTWLLNNLLSPALTYNLADPAERTRLATDPDALRRECEALPEDQRLQTVLVDEAQTVPSVFDSVQYLFDQNPERWKFVLCGSSARKMRQAGANLLPGRAILHRLYPLILAERPARAGQSSPGLIVSMDWQGDKTFPPCGLMERLAYGDLPGITALQAEEKALLLRSYAEIYLIEEIRREALVRDWAAFVNFLRLAAAESGSSLNYSRLSNEVGLSVPTIKSHYQLLEDMFVGFTVPAFSQSSRKSLLSTPRFLFFDIGVRHAAAGLRPGLAVVKQSPGGLFEQWVGLELHRRLSYRQEGSLSYYRTKHGAEIDYIVELEDRLLPVEVKWTEYPTEKDTRHLHSFMSEHANAPEGFVVCRCKNPQKLSARVTAIPWYMI